MEKYGKYVCRLHHEAMFFLMPQQFSNSGNRLNLFVLRRWKSSAAWGRMECSCLNSKQMKRVQLWADNCVVATWSWQGSATRCATYGHRGQAHARASTWPGWKNWIDHRIPVQQILMCPHCFPSLDFPWLVELRCLGWWSRNISVEMHRSLQKFKSSQKRRRATLLRPFCWEMPNCRATLQTSVATSSRKGLCFLYTNGGTNGDFGDFCAGIWISLSRTCRTLHRNSFYRDRSQFFCDIVDLLLG